MIRIQCVSTQQYRLGDGGREEFPRHLPIRPLTGEFIHKIDSQGTIMLNAFPILAISHIFIREEFVLRLHLGTPVEFPNE